MTEPIPTQPPSDRPSFGPPPIEQPSLPSQTPIEKTKQSSRKRSALLILAAVTSVAAIGAATPSIVNATQGQGHSTTHALQTEQDLDLDNVRLGDLAKELQGLGLDLVVTPTPENWIGSELDQGNVETSEYEDLDDYEEGPGDSYGTDEVDPFAGMTDEEIDALSDEEFFTILEDAGVDIWSEDGDWDDGEWDEAYDDEDDWDDSDSQDSDSYDDSETLLASFKVVDDKLVGSDASAGQVEQANAIWNRFVQIIPASERTMLSGFELMSSEYGGAHVYADESDPNKWIMGVDNAMTGDDLDYVLIHEFGHLLTLKASEVPPNSNDGSCPTFDPGEGCALSQSTLAEFVAAFWPQSLQDELRRLNESGDWDALEAYYNDNADSFVTDYAMSNPVEDLAETFTEFVMKDRPGGNTIADQKVQMLWSDQDMVALRSEIRSRL